MTGIIDKILIFIILVLFCFLGITPSIHVVTILTVISFSCIFTYISQKKFLIIGVIAYSILCYFFQEFILFIPLLCYDLLFTRYQMFIIIFFIPVLLQFTDHSLISNLIPFIFLFIIFLIKYKTLELEKEKINYYKLRDSSQELSLTLKEKNNELLEKQDYEIHLATLKERNRISMEIHDNVGHLLSSSILQIGAILATSQDSKTKKSLETVNTTLSTAMNSIRNSIHNIHDTYLLLEPLVTDIINHFTFCKIHLDYTVSQNPNAKTAYAIISILKESLSNIMKHSNANLVEVTIREHPALYQVQIKDNGTMIENNVENGIGIKNMETRISELNGNFHISTESGFKIFISIPKENEK